MKPCKICGDLTETVFKDYSGVECTVEPVEMSALVESMKQEAHLIGFAVDG